ncbi:MAG: histone deacetylase [Candidatus Tectimicrobiota bacterium]
MFVLYHPGYVVDLGEAHRFPMAKYRLVYERLLLEGTLDGVRLLQPEPVAVADLLLVHTQDYVERFLRGQMALKDMRLLGFPWSAALARRARLATQGTLSASVLAWEQHGLAANLAGGSHHAFADHGEGFSVFNDIAVAIRVLQHDYGLQRALIMDCDVHQGNGTAAIFRGDPQVFTCSLHGAKNYPFRKEQSSLDIELPDGTTDDAYLEVLCAHLPRVLECFQPQMVWYLAGVDPYAGDKLGRLALSLDGLRQRDAYVLQTCWQAGLPVVTTMGGGYAPQIEDVVEAHCTTVRLACRLAGAARP